MTYTAYIQQGEIMYVATCLENGVVSQWESPQIAIENLQEAVYAYNLVEVPSVEIDMRNPFSCVSTFSLPQYA